MARHVENPSFDGTLDMPHREEESPVSLEWARNYFCDLLAPYIFEPAIVKFALCSPQGIVLYELQPRENAWVEVQFGCLQSADSYDEHWQSRQEMEVLYGLVQTHVKAWSQVYGSTFPDRVLAELRRGMAVAPYPSHGEWYRRHRHRWPPRLL